MCTVLTHKQFFTFLVKEIFPKTIIRFTYWPTIIILIRNSKIITIHVSLFKIFVVVLQFTDIIVKICTKYNLQQ